MNILGIETSCDETAVSIIKDGRIIICSNIASSVEMHTKTGGIIPEQAARQQILSIIPILEASQIKTEEIDALAVTIGPGLIGSLLVGIETAKTLAFLWQKPIVPVNHLIGHIYANWLVSSDLNRKEPEFPLLALVVSGGHTNLVLMENHGQIKYIGGTRDDAAGEAFDKCARLLGLPYPGGPSISAKANEFLINKSTLKLQLLPRPLIGENNYDWSFSGLKTAVLKQTKLPDQSVSIEELSAQVQEAIVEVLVRKTLKAVHQYQPKGLLLAGGVSANHRLREIFSNEVNKLDQPPLLYLPEPKYSTDNAASIASCAYYNYQPTSFNKITADPNLTIT